MIFKKNIWVYDVELDGEIEKQYTLFKTKRKKWVFLENNKITEVYEIQELLKETGINYNPDLKFIYILESELGYKIGKSGKVEKRFNAFNIKMPFAWRVLNIFAVHHKQINQLEKFLHKRLENKKINGEWFDLSNEDISIIKKFIESMPSYL